MKRPMPADFAAVAPTMPLMELRARYGTGYEQINRWLKEAGIRSKPVQRPTRPMPKDFADIAPALTIKQLQKHYAAGHEVIGRWLKEAGVLSFNHVHKPPQPHRLPIPEDFAEVAPHMTQVELHRRYGRDYTVIRRWCREAGVEPLPRVYAPPPRRKRMDRKTGLRGSNIQNIRASSIYDEAASVIQRERFAVYRCNERGAADHTGNHWRVGNVVLTPAELLERAERYTIRAARIAA